MTGVKIPNITKEDVEGLTGFIRRTIEDIGCKASS